MVRLLRGVVRILVVTAPKSKISSEVCVRYRRPNYAFAAILSDGGVVTWGDPGDGGDSSEVQDQLRNVQQIQATESAFDGLNLLHVPELIFTWQSSHGATKLGVVTALPSKINFGMCSRFKLHRRHLLQSWMTDRLLLGVLQTLVVTALQCKIGSDM